MELEANWKRALKIFWAYLWRISIAQYLFIILLDFSFNINLHDSSNLSYSTSHRDMSLMSFNRVLKSILSFFSYFFFSTYFIKKVLNKSFDEFNIVLMKNEFKGNELKTNVNKEIEITWKRSLILFWAYLWRSVLTSFTMPLILIFIFIIWTFIFTPKATGIAIAGATLIITCLITLNLSLPFIFFLSPLPFILYYIQEFIPFFFLCSITISIFISIYYFKKILNKDFDKFKIVLIKKEY